MSTRGINFLDKWMAEHLPNAMTDDPAAICDLVGQVMKAAKREGIDPDEINQEVDSIFGVIFDAMQHRASAALPVEASEAQRPGGGHSQVGRWARPTACNHRLVWHYMPFSRPR
ncbi:DUF768 domain-containing protein [Mesorhizobium sp. USDA-HM6]|nr:DUF768 domain-containing protein [Mesorhizobium sp. USDA-HM6]